MMEEIYFHQVYVIIFASVYLNSSVILELARNKTNVILIFLRNIYFFEIIHKKNMFNLICPLLSNICFNNILMLLSKFFFIY